METTGIAISVETAAGYEVPGAIRAALERLAEAIQAEAGSAEVEGFAARPEDLGSLNPLSPHTGKFGPKEPLQMWCLGGFDCGDFAGGSHHCNWAYNY